MITSLWVLDCPVQPLRMKAATRGYKVKVIEIILRGIFAKEVEGIQVHEYGAHIFPHERQEDLGLCIICDILITLYRPPVTSFNGEIYNLPFNMNTFNKLWGVVTPQEANENC